MAIVAAAIMFASSASSCMLSVARSMVPAAGASTSAPNAGAAASTAAPSGRGTAAPAGSGPQVAAKGGLATRFFAPYLPLEMFEYDFPMATGPAKNYTLAFVLSDAKGTLLWDGTQPLANPKVIKRVDELRRAGGDVIISCGGANGSEVGTVIKDVAKLTAAYQSIVSMYKLKMLDLDIEGGSVSGPSVDIRNKALVALKKANPGLKISYTLAADKDGVNYLSVDLLSNAKKNGLVVDCVNAMLMDFGGVSASGVISGAKATIAQLNKIGMTSTSVGICFMLGVNDSGGTMTLADAEAVAKYAKGEKRVMWMSFWSVARDNGSCAGRKYADAKCSGVAQSTYAYANAVKKSFP